MNMEELNKTIEKIWEDSYVVPLYQRNFAWGYEQIGQFLQDIYDSFKNSEEHYYVGSLVVTQRTDGTFEVIDGQQRLTILSLICRVLNILNESHLSYDSRPEIERFFNGLFKSKWENYVEECKQESNGAIARLLEAIDCITQYRILLDADKQEYKTITQLPKNSSDKTIADYIKNNVILVRTILPEDTDVAAYFEIMNNRGEQLQEHEIVKALMMECLGQREKNVFSLVWDACSQMNVPIQKNLLKFTNLFGSNFEFLNVDVIDEYKEDIIKISTNQTIEEVLNGINDVNTHEIDDDFDEKYEAIVDFPNFLMYVFKMVLETTENKVPLNADKLLATHQENKNKFQDPMIFIKKLLKCRVLFDRFVIKNQGDENEIENVKWVLHRPYFYGNSLRFRNTFGKGNNEADDAEEEKDVQKRIIKQQSMLQVTFRNRRYKNWLFDFLKEIMDKEIENILGTDIIAYFDKWMCKYYEKEQTNGMFNAGTGTPHFLFNFIDYLYWVEHINNGINNIENIKYVEDFDFKYYNSVEHHLPQSYTNIKEEETDDKKRIIDNIGNLCLISGSINSSLNDKGPVEKAKYRPGLMPKRKIMYAITLTERKWDIEEIKKHGKDIEDLLSHHKEILGIG